MSRRDSGQALVPSRLLFRSAYLVYDGINARISEFNSTSIQGLLQDDLQKDFCPYYLEKVCRLLVWRCEGLCLLDCVRLSMSEISQSRISKITP